MQAAGPLSLTSPRPSLADPPVKPWRAGPGAPLVPRVSGQVGEHVPDRPARQPARRPDLVLSEPVGPGQQAGMRCRAQGDGSGGVLLLVRRHVRILSGSDPHGAPATAAGPGLTVCPAHATGPQA